MVKNDLILILIDTESCRSPHHKKSAKKGSFETFAVI